MTSFAGMDQDRQERMLQAQLRYHRAMVFLMVLSSLITMTLLVGVLWGVIKDNETRRLQTSCIDPDGLCFQRYHEEGVQRSIAVVVCANKVDNKEQARQCIERVLHDE